MIFIKSRIYEKGLIFFVCVKWQYNVNIDNLWLWFAIFTYYWCIIKSEKEFVIFSVFSISLKIYEGHLENNEMICAEFRKA